MKLIRILIVSIFACMLMIPLASMTAAPPSVHLNVPIESRSTPAQDFYRIGTIEGIVTQIDPEGGVRNAVGSFQNASYYGITHTTPYQAAAESQMATDTGYVAACQLEMAGRAVYPTGRIGEAYAMLTILVNPIVVLPANASEWYMSEPTLQEAQQLAEEFVALYETDFLIEFHRLTTLRQDTSVNFNTSYVPSASYILQYVCFPDASDADTAMSALRTRLSGLGGFMDLLDGTGWPVERTVFAESIFFTHQSEESMFAGPPGFNPLYMYPSVFTAYVRADPSHPEYVEDVLTGILGMAGFDTPDYITDGTGNETYSLKQHVGYTGDIESKMFQDMTINSISSIVAVAPTHLDVDGIATEWDHIDKDFTFNSSSPIPLPTGGSVPGNASADEIIQALMVDLPMSFAMSLNYSISTMDPNMFDSFIDGIWASPGPFPDFREELLAMDWSTVFMGVPFEEVNQDALRMVMEKVGITPDILMTQVNETLIEENPMQALVEAFIATVDSYHLLDIFKNTTYSNPYVLEGFLNGYIDDINTFIEDFIGVDLPSSYATKESFAALIEDHFGLVLQGLWDAMAAFVGDTTAIKTVVQAMIDPEHLSSETVPYFMADMYTSAVSEYDYEMYINFELPDLGSVEPWDPPLLWLTTDDVVLTFDLDISNIDFEGPHCIIRKSMPQSATLGNDFTVTISVENLGDATAYDLKILDGISAGFDVDKQYYWNKATLAASETWTETLQITPEEVGTYAIIPVILCYFNVSLDTFNSSEMLDWDGAVMYTTSAIGGEISVTTTPTTTPTTTTTTTTTTTAPPPIELPMIIILAGGAGVVVIVIVVILRKKS